MSSIDNILNFIEKKGYSVRQFEAEAGLSNGTLNENKKRQADLSAKNIEKISKKFGEELLQYGYYVLDLSAFGRPGEFAIVNEKEMPGGQYRAPAQEPSPMQILQVLADAFRDQAAAFNTQAAILRNIEDRMAQESSLQEALSVVETIADRQGPAIQKILSDLDELKRRKNGP